MSGRNVTLILITVLVLFVASNSLYVIKETERGVLLQFGEVVNPDIQPGIGGGHVRHFREPGAGGHDRAASDGPGARKFLHYKSRGSLIRGVLMLRTEI